MVYVRHIRQNTAFTISSKITMLLNGLHMCDAILNTIYLIDNFYGLIYLILPVSNTSGCSCLAAVEHPTIIRC